MTTPTEPERSLHQTAEKTPYARAIALAWPASLASMATPLLGAVDVWALGQSARPLDIAAVGLASVIFSLIYWTVGFIRMSVAGLTAQALGADNEARARTSLAHGLIVGAGVGVILVVTQSLIAFGAFRFLAIGSEASGQTFEAARTYFHIRIFGAPFALATYALFGWLTARGRTDALMVASIGMTLVNGILDYVLVVHAGQGAAGVAFGTAIAEIAGFVFAGAYVLTILKGTGGLGAHWRLATLRDPEALRKTLRVNTDIFVRTLLLAICFSWFTQRSGAFGDVTLAANQALLQLFLFTGLALDGTAIAAETMIGRAVGQRRGAGMEMADHNRGIVRAIKATSVPALALAIIFTLIYAVAGEAIVALLTPEGPIRAAALRYLPWIVISPLILVWPFQIDGVFIGATLSGEMRNGMIMSGFAFFAATAFLMERFGNHGLWLAFSVYFLMRALTLAIYLPRLFRS